GRCRSGRGRRDGLGGGRRQGPAGLEGRTGMGRDVLAFRGQPDRAAGPGGGEAGGGGVGEVGARSAGMGDRGGGARRPAAAGPGGAAGNAVLTGYVVIDAADLDAAATLAAGCPGLASGVDVEVGEVIAS